jgi:DNA-binding NarL/FixJ family response regulator
MARRVLIIDDNLAFREALARLLERSGFSVVGCAAEGAEGLLLVRERRPDLAIVDVQLPDIDGFAVAEQLVAQQGAPDVIITSILDRTDLVGLLADSPARGFLPKSELTAGAIEQLLGRAA